MAVASDERQVVERDQPPPTARRNLTRLGRMRRDWLLLLLALPGLGTMLVFHYGPMWGNIVAFLDYQPFLGIIQSEWVGFENFSIIINGDSAFLTAVKNTFVLTALQAFFVFPAPIALALLLNSLFSEWLKRLVQSILYLPHFLSWVIVVALFQQMFGNTGLLNSWLRDRGADAFEIVGNADLFMAMITSQVIWKDAGWATILFLAALSRVDMELYEASAIDGASKTRQTWHVTLPALRGLIILLAILRLGDALTVGFEQILLQQAAVGPAASEVLDTYVYNHGIVNGEWGTSAAVGLVKGVIGVVLVLGANKIAHIFGEDGVYRSR